MPVEISFSVSHHSPTAPEKGRIFTERHPTACKTPSLEPHFEKHDQ